MPRKKQGAAISATLGAVICPACKSEISADGSTLQTMSKYLTELIEAAGDAEKLEKTLEALEKKLAEKKAAETQVPAKEVNPKTEAPKNVATQGNGPKPGESKPKPDWW